MTHPTTAATQTALITGGSTGLGFQVARHIALHYPGWQVIIANRSQGAGQEAAARIRAEAPAARIDALPLDLGSLANVRAFAQTIIGRGLPPIRALVCNAGLQMVTDARTTDGFETTFGVNHLGHFLLTQLLLPHLAPPARIIYVSSGTHFAAEDGSVSKGGMPDPVYTTAQAAAFPPPADGGDLRLIGRQRYSTSKLANVWHTYELARRLERALWPGPITVNAYDPGLMPGTGLARDYAPVVAWMWERLLPRVPLLARLVFGDTPTPVPVSGANLARLACDPAWAGVNARYIAGDQVIPSSKASYDAGQAHELWEASKALVKLTAAETALA